MSKRLAILLLLLPALLAEGQSIRLTKYQAPTALYLDVDRLYNFNLYERSRFQVDLTWTVPNESCPTAKYFLGQWTFRGYGAYSVGDEDFKYGASAQLRLSNKSNTRIRLRAFKDLERAASRRLSTYHMLSPALNTGYVSSRYVGVRGAELALMSAPTKSFNYQLGFRQSWEDYRFNAQGLLYPTRYPQQQTEVKRFSEFSTRLSWTKGFVADLRAGCMSDSAQHYYLRSLFQYSSSFGNSGLNLFSQLGFSTEETPYSRMFDISGTSNAIYFFKYTFLTVAPNMFTANTFAQLCLNYTAPLPLWKLSWSSPRPFLQLNGLWGHLFGQDEYGFRYWDGLPLQAPYLGVFEVASGFDGLVHWGLLDLGFGVAYQLCPTSASYFNQDPSKNFSFTIVADLILDKYNK